MCSSGDACLMHAWRDPGKEAQRGVVRYGLIPSGSCGMFSEAYLSSYVGYPRQMSGALCGVQLLQRHGTAYNFPVASVRGRSLDVRNVGPLRCATVGRMLQRFLPAWIPGPQRFRDPSPPFPPPLPCPGLLGMTFEDQSVLSVL